jgi:mono/diheme cytochrome c family protein
VRVPVTVKILGLTVGSTLFYTWVGQLVPQKEVQPPEVVEMSQDMTTEQLVEIGQEIFDGKGICATCHTIGSSGALRFPDLDGIATRAADRIPGLDQVGYLAQSLYEPEAYIVPGFNPGMPAMDKPPIGLSDDEIRAVIAYLQTLGGEATMTMATSLPYAEGADATSDVDPAGAGDAPPQSTEDQGPGADPSAADAVGEALVAGDTGRASSGGADAGLFTRYGCDDCHSTEPGGELTLAGSSATAQQLFVEIVEHEPPLDGTVASRMTLDEVRALARYLAGLSGGGS